MFCAYTRPRYQVSVYRTIGPLVIGHCLDSATVQAGQENGACDDRLYMSKSY